MDIEFKLESVLIQAVRENKDFHQIAGSLRAIFHDLEVEPDVQVKLLTNLFNLINTHHVNSKS